MDGSISFRKSIGSSERNLGRKCRALRDTEKE